MMRTEVKIAMSFFTIIVGILAAVWVIKPARNLPSIQSSNNTPETAATSVLKDNIDPANTLIKFCDLIRNSNRYDGKLIRMQAIYTQGIDTHWLDDPECGGFLLPSCGAVKTTCRRIYDYLWGAGKTGKIKVDLVGRYKADAIDPNPFQGSRHVRLFEIHELTGVN